MEIGQNFFGERAFFPAHLQEPIDRLASGRVRLAENGRERYGMGRHPGAVFDLRAGAVTAVREAPALDARPRPTDGSFGTGRSMEGENRVGGRLHPRSLAREVSP